MRKPKRRYLKCYAMHKPIQQIINKVFEKLLVPNVFGHFVDVYIGSALTITTITVIGMALNKLTPHLFYILNGGRTQLLEKRVRA